MLNTTYTLKATYVVIYALYKLHMQLYIRAISYLSM